jgi:hypothetical protein
MSIEPARASGVLKLGFPIRVCSRDSPGSREALFPSFIFRPFPGVEIQSFEDIQRTSRNSSRRSGDVAPLEESLPDMHKSLGHVPSTPSTGCAGAPLYSQR